MLSLNSLILILAGLGWIIFLYVSAAQIVNKNFRVKIFNVSVPLLTWVFGILTTSLLITSYFLQRLGLLSWLENEVMSLIYFLALCVLTLYSLIATVAIQILQIPHHATSLYKLKLSSFAGLIAIIGFGSFFAAIWVLQDNSNSVNVSGIICLLIPAYIVVVSGTYSQIQWRQRFESKLDSYRTLHARSDKENPDL